jgi:hypothetical protein
MIDFNIPKLETRSALKFASQLNSCEISEPVHFDASMAWVRPFGMLFTACVLRQFRRKYPDFQFSLTPHEECKGVSYAAQMGFFKEVSTNFPVGKAPGEANGNANYIPITELDLEKIWHDEVQEGNYIELEDSIEEVSKKLARILGRDNMEANALFTYLLREILRNIPEHANCSKALICGQYYSDNTAEIAIIDEGIGILKSLQSNSTHRMYVNTDKDALECAIRPGISSAFNPGRGQKNNGIWDNSGFGLYMVNEICQRLGGSFCIASGNNFIEYTANGTFSEGDTYFEGTAIKIGVSTSSLKDCSKLISEISAQGEKQAQSIKHAFKTASKPSKGLITDF